MKALFLLLVLLAPANMLVAKETWQPPIGIPVPSFGIEDTYRMYDDPNARNPEMTYRESDSGGFYTHYIDPCDAAATDSGNSYGSISKPRLSVPRNLPAGSVVEIHNTANQNGWNYLNISGMGTRQHPIFVRGVNSPYIPCKLELGNAEESHYIIVEDIRFQRGNIKDCQPLTDTENSYLCVRNCDFDGDGTAGYMVGILTWGSGNTLTHSVFYNNTIHDSGTWNPDEATGDKDYHGITMNGNVSYSWIVDNEIYHCEGDGMQINAGNDADAINHIFAGRNLVYECKQAGLGSKTASDVIFSQNTVYGFRHSSSADGEGFEVLYDPKRVWHLFNRSYNNKWGFGMGSQNLGTREEIYYIGNLIYDCQTAGIRLHNQQNLQVLFNTIYNCPTGIMHGWYGFSASIYNNVISGCPTAIDLLDQHGSEGRSDMDYNLLDGTGNIIWDKTYTDLASFQVGTDQGDHCIEANPMFVDPANGNFNLQDTSPVNNLVESPKVQVVFDRFRQLYGIDLREDIEGKERTIYNIADLNPAPNVVSSSSASREQTSNNVTTNTSPLSQANAGQIQEESTGSVTGTSSDNSNNTNQRMTGFSNPNNTNRKIFNNFDRLYRHDNMRQLQKEYYE